MIYKASFINPVDNSYDTLDTDKLNMITLYNSVLEGQNEKYEIAYEIILGKSDLGMENIKIIGKIDSLNIVHTVSLELQEFVDAMSAAIQAREVPDYQELIKRTKEAIEKKASKDLLDMGILINNVDYDAFGYISSMGDKIGTFESVSLDENVIKLGEALSALELKNAKSLSVEFILSNKKYMADVTYKEENVVTYNTINIIDAEKPYDVKSKDDFESFNDLYEYRRKLVIQNKIIDNTDIDDEFADLF